MQHRHLCGWEKALFLAWKQETRSRSSGCSSNKNTNSEGRGKRITVAERQELSVVSVAGSVLMREVSRDQITMTPSLPPACHIMNKGENHRLIYLQCHLYGKGALDFGRI